MTQEPPSVSALLDQLLRTLVQADDEAIDAAASALAAADPPAVSTALLAAAEGSVRRAWENGWQPADLARLVRRDLEPRHLALAVDAIAAEARHHPHTTHPSPRWTAQLRDLDATVHWSGDDTHLAAFAAHHRLDRFTAIGTALELLRLTTRLPRITPLTTPTHSTPSTAAPTAPTTRMLTRIRALLAKAEATPFPEEAEALTAKAQHLATRHSIDEALLTTTSTSTTTAPAQTPTACRIGIDDPYAAAKAVLLDAVAAANRCRTIWSSDLGFSTVIGYEPDLTAVELLHASLLAQATAAMNRAADQHHRSGKSRRTRDFRQTFLVAFAGRIRTRLASAADQAARESAADAADTADTSRRLLPVLAARELAVADATDRMFPTTTSHRLRGSDPSGWEHGTAAADRARLPHPDRHLTRTPNPARPTPPPHPTPNPPPPKTT
ncbi:DUF2786 domain-containing protein [Peterkaempfera bronchialis]|uniref:DUF2786 domain-containing protein n=1 Tax=Peterkaempfera bronchialis TaxID=2126346 RepID=UPI003C2DD5CC